MKIKGKIATLSLGMVLFFGYEAFAGTSCNVASSDASLSSPFVAQQDTARHGRGPGKGQRPPMDSLDHGRGPRPPMDSLGRPRGPRPDSLKGGKGQRPSRSQK